MSIIDSILHAVAALSWMTQAGTVLGLAAVWLTIRENLWNFPLGLASVVLVTIVMFRQRLYADTAMQVFYFCAMGYGWWVWTHPETRRPQRPVTRLRWRQLVVLMVVGVIGTWGLQQVLAQVNDAMPWRDAFIAVFGILSQFLQAYKKIETWPGWVLVNTAGVVIFIVLSLYWLVVLYAVMLGLSFVGWRQWLASYRAEKPSQVRVADAPVNSL